MFTVKNTLETATNLVAFVTKNNLVPVFDMDGVFADATHRQICNPDGSLNLDRYREMSTAEYIAKDKELPLIEALKALQATTGVYICTARVACENTKNWLESRGIKPLGIFARDGEHDCRRDYELKSAKLSANFMADELAKMVLIDDNSANCRAAQRLGMVAVNVEFDGH